MKLNGKDVLICSCEDTMALDGDTIAKATGGDGTLRPARHLCRVEMDRFTDVAGKSEHLLVACTQEAPLFLDALEDMGENAPTASFVNIRERAGWSELGQSKNKNITAKMAALIA